MSASLLVDLVGLAAAAALLMGAAVVALTSNSLGRRLGALIVAHVAVVIGLAALGAPGGVLIAGVASGFVYCALGVSLLVRAQEMYGSAEIEEIDAADDQGERTERSA